MTLMTLPISLGPCYPMVPRAGGILAAACVLLLSAMAHGQSAPGGSVFGSPAATAEQLLAACIPDGQLGRVCTITGATATKGPAAAITANTTFRTAPAVAAASLDELASSRVYLDVTRARGALPVAAGVTVRLEGVLLRGAASDTSRGLGPASFLALLAFPLGLGSQLELRQCVLEVSCSELGDYQAHACSTMLPSSDVEVRIGVTILAPPKLPT